MYPCSNRCRPHIPSPLTASGEYRSDVDPSSFAIWDVAYDTCIVYGIKIPPTDGLAGPRYIDMIIDILSTVYYNNI